MRPAPLSLIVAAVVASPFVARAQASYVLDASASMVSFQGRALFQSIDGRSDDLVGMVTLLGRDIRSLRGTIQIPVASLHIEPPISRREVEQLFGGGPGAEIVFRVDSLSRYDGRLLLHGQLTMNGVSRPVAFAGEVWHRPGSRIEARGKARVDMREWRIRPPTRFLGLVSMHHELTLSFDATFAPRAMARGGDVIELAPQLKER
jgi:polyisoprenoid-binding protein YceI